MCFPIYLAAAEGGTGIAVNITGGAEDNTVGLKYRRYWMGKWVNMGWMKVGKLLNGFVI